MKYGPVTFCTRFIYLGNCYGEENRRCIKISYQKFSFDLSRLDAKGNTGIGNVQKDCVEYIFLKVDESISAILISVFYKMTAIFGAT